MMASAGSKLALPPLAGAQLPRPLALAADLLLAEFDEKRDGFHLFCGRPAKKARIDHPARIEVSFLVTFEASYNRAHTAGGGHRFFPNALTQILIDNLELGIVEPRKLAQINDRRIGMFTVVPDSFHICLDKSFHPWTVFSNQRALGCQSVVRILYIKIRKICQNIQTHSLNFNNLRRR